MKSRAALGKSLAAIDDTATNHIANISSILRECLWDVKAANPSLPPQVITATGVATTTTNSIKSQIEHNWGR